MPQAFSAINVGTSISSQHPKPKQFPRSALIKPNNDPVILWFRHDLRLADNPALTEAVVSGAPIVPVFIWAPDEEDLDVGAASRWWLHQSLAQLEKSLLEKKSRLVLQRGPTQKTLLDLIEETGAKKVFWNRRYEPAIVKRDTLIKDKLTKAGIETKSFRSHVLYEPWQLRTGEGKPYQVFTRYWERAQSYPPPGPTFPVPDTIPAPDRWPQTVELKSFCLESKIPWAKEFFSEWEPGEAGAHKALQKFLRTSVDTYQSARDIPSEGGTSRLSPHLHFGEISIRQTWNTVNKTLSKKMANAARSVSTYLKELGWREFAHHLLYEFPHTAHQPLRPNFEKFPWEKNPATLKAWQKGQTGYPIVDAGMRELWTTGWMHNRVRMIVASFLVKHLRMSWTEGAAWFWDTLVDADLANNTLGWQWSAGCGADAAPYFRIFNPILQGEKFDAEGRYVRKWVPELQALPNKWIHKPWEAPSAVLEKANVTLGKNYPLPIVDHAQARELALGAFQKIKKV